MTAWMDDAACLTVDPEVMQPEAAHRADVERAKRLCHDCPVFRQCRQHALEQEAGPHPPYGIHAGEWWGEEPTWLDDVCRTCSAPVKQPATGRPRLYCSDRCRMASRNRAMRA